MRHGIALSAVLWGSLLLLNIGVVLGGDDRGGGATPEPPSTTSPVVNAASDWLHEHLAQLARSEAIEDLDFVPDFRVRLLRGDRTVLAYRFTQHGIPVEGARARLLVAHEATSATVLGGTVVTERPLDPGIPRLPTIDRGVAIRAARRLDEAVGLTHWGDPERVIVGPASFASLSRSHLAWKVSAHSSLDGGRSDLRSTTFFLDAHDATLLGLREERCDDGIRGNVAGKATPGLEPDLPSNPPTPMVVPDAEVAVPSLVSTLTDEAGAYALAVAPMSVVGVQTELVGPWVVVTPEQGSPLTQASIVESPGVADFVFNNGPQEFATSQLNAYLHTIGTRNFYRSRAPSFAPLDVPLPCFVNLDDSCGAFFLPEPLLSINFHAAGGGCPNTAYSTIVSHEFGHFIVDRLGLEQLSFGEGFADALSALRFDTPIIGADLYGPGEPIRDIVAADVSFPCFGEIHGCGLVLAGVWWDLRQELGTRLGSALGLDVARQLFVDWSLLTVGPLADFSAHPGTGIEVLFVDDDDGDLTNGTPNYAAIRAAFDRHDLRVPAVRTLAFDYPDGRPDRLYPTLATPFRVDAGALVNAPLPDTGRLHLSVNGGSEFIVPMTWLGESHYRARIPALPAGARVDYSVSVKDELDIRSGDPFDPIASTFTVFVGSEATVVFSDDFESDRGWTSEGSAVEGHWVRVDPDPTSVGGFPLQPGVDHTEAGTHCFVTGQGVADGTIDRGDVDGGAVLLTSPLLDLSAPGVYQVEYWRWINGLPELYYLP
ncbi:MAG: hypothetical protein KDC38_04245, partial [Planctomycetes bacterium]|nr:hypothetical protein [Planctomycetota bacterium]